MEILTFWLVSFLFHYILFKASLQSQLIDYLRSHIVGVVHPQRLGAKKKKRKKGLAEIHFFQTRLKKKAGAELCQAHLKINVPKIVAYLSCSVGRTHFARTKTQLIYYYTAQSVNIRDNFHSHHILLAISCVMRGKYRFSYR